MENTSTHSPREEEPEQALDSGSLISDDFNFQNTQGLPSEEVNPPTEDTERGSMGTREVMPSRLQGRLLPELWMDGEAFPWCRALE